MFYLNSALPEMRGFYALSSYNGNAGKRSYPDTVMTRDGVFFIDSHIRLRDVTDGSSNTLLIGERCHPDAEYERISPGGYPLGRLGGLGQGP